MNKIPSIRFDMLTGQVAAISAGIKTSTVRIIKGLPAVRSADVAGIVSMNVPAPRKGGLVGKMAFVRHSQNFAEVLKNGPWVSAPYVKGKVYSVNGLRRYIVIDDIEVIQLQDLTDGEILRDGVRYSSYGFYVPGIAARPEEDSFMDCDFGPCRLFKTPREAAAALYDKIYGAGTWAKDPWCWRYTFHRAELAEVNKAIS